MDVIAFGTANVSRLRLRLRRDERYGSFPSFALATPWQASRRQQAFCGKTRFWAVLGSAPSRDRPCVVSAARKLEFRLTVEASASIGARGVNCNPTITPPTPPWQGGESLHWRTSRQWHPVTFPPFMKGGSRGVLISELRRARTAATGGGRYKRSLTVAARMLDGRCIAPLRSRLL